METISRAHAGLAATIAFVLAASRQILEQYSALRVITAYFYSDPEAARERTYDEKNHPFATLDMGQTYAPKLTFFDSNRTLLVR